MRGYLIETYGTLTSHSIHEMDNLMPGPDEER